MYPTYFDTFGGNGQNGALKVQAESYFWGPTSFTTGGTITADSEAAPKERAFDDEISTYWQSVGGGAGHWIKYDLGSGVTKIAKKLRIFNSGATGGPSNNGIAGFYFQGSNNDSSWDTLISDTCPAAAAWYEFFCQSNTIAYRYYRVYSTSSYHVDAILIKELEFLENFSYIAQYTTLTINSGINLYVPRAGGPTGPTTGASSMAIVGVQGLCTIHGNFVVLPTYQYDNQQDNSWYTWYDMTNGIHLGGGAGQSSGFFTGTSNTYTGGTKGAPGTKISQADAISKTGGWGDNIHHIKKFDKNWFVNGGGGGCGGGSNHSVSGGTWGGTGGGGVLYIECGELVFDGTMSCNGGNGMVTDYGPGYYQCAGGGGGVLIVRAKKITTNTGTVTVNGGNATGIGSLDAAYSGGEGFMDVTTALPQGPFPTHFND